MIRRSLVRWRLWRWFTRPQRITGRLIQEYIDEITEAPVRGSEHHGTLGKYPPEQNGTP